MKKKISLYTLIALIIGVVCGIYLKNYVGYVDFIGTIYINILKFLIGPIIFTSITVTIFMSNKKESNLVFRAIGLFVTMFVTTFLLTSLVVYVLKPTEGFVFDSTDYTGTISDLSIKDIIVNLFPSNLINMFANNQLFAIIMFSFLVGYCATKVKNGNKVIEFIKVLRDIFFKILEYVMYITPFAVFSLIANTVAKYGAILIGVALKYIGTAYLCGLLTMIFVMVLPVSIFAKINPFTYIKKIYKVWMISTTTCSSAATLPTTLRTCNEELGIDSSITDVVVPLGCTIHMCGGAVSFALLGLFCSSLFGVQVTGASYILMLVSAVIINMSAPGNPNGGVVIGATYLQLLGIPLEFIGFYSGIYKILDMLYTTLNVSGDITANVILAGKKDKK